TPRQYASLVFTPEIENRGWPQTGQNFGIYETSAAAQDWLRLLVMQVLQLSWDFSEASEIATASAAIRESLLAAIDAAFASMVPARWALRANT
ncbi:hypothetical protein ACS22W_25680, partial [Escherichia coli]|uniref:hypothetical protein n=1 Tax=Escherichia coli TaxID=562 RepID=UPI003F296255